MTEFGLCSMCICIAYSAIDFYYPGQALHLVCIYGSLACLGGFKATADPARYIALSVTTSVKSVLRFEVYSKK